MTANPLDLRIVAKGDSPFHHCFGGQEYTLFPTGLQAAVILTLDCGERPLSQLKVDAREIPLCSGLYYFEPAGPQRYTFDANSREIRFSEPPRTYSLAPEQEYPPFPRRPVRLRSPSSQELSEDPEVVYDTFLGGAGFMRIGGEPLWLTGPHDVLCSCGAEVRLLASVGYEVGTADYLDSEPFFLGELALFFFFCENCQVVTVFTDA